MSKMAMTRAEYPQKRTPRKGNLFATLFHLLAKVNRLVINLEDMRTMYALPFPFSVPFHSFVVFLSHVGVFRTLDTSSAVLEVAWGLYRGWRDSCW